MTNWEPGSSAEFKKNEDYYEAKTVKIEKLVMKLVQNPKVAAQSLWQEKQTMHQSIRIW